MTLENQKKEEIYSTLGHLHMHKNTITSDTNQLPLPYARRDLDCKFPWKTPTQANP